MTRKGTITLALLAISILAWFFFVDFRQQQPSTDGLLFHLNPEHVSRIVITDGNDSHLLEREAGEWYISTIPPDRANNEEIAHLLAIASELKPLNILNPKELKNNLSLSSLGLENPKRSLTIHQDGESDQTLFIGNEAVGEKSLFARMEKQKAVLIIPSTLADIAFHSNDNFRDLHLTNLKLSDLKEISVTQGISKLCLKKENGKWEMTQPISAKISSDALQAWITPLLTTEVLARVGSDKTDLSTLSAYGLDQPRATINFVAENSSEPTTLSLGNAVEEKNSENSSLYLCSTARHAIFKAPAFLAQLFMITPEILRDRQFLELNLDTVDRIEITTAGKTLSLRRQPGGSEDWVLEDQTAVPKAAVEKMLQALAKTKILSYQMATPSKMALVGLDDPLTATATIKFIAHLSENTPDEEAGDHTVLEIIFGKKIGETIFARLGNDPELLEVPAGTVDVLNVK
ncbi:MAG: DUF4340 domain-containing protein [Chthoniobacterales bacterium]